jgi:hypothetical protein
MDYPVSKYISQAKTVYTNLVPIFKQPANAWQIGNVFDTLTDWVAYFPDANPAGTEVVQAARDQWDSFGSMCWYDDYGWWGIASAKAFDDKYATMFGSNRAKFQQIATDCWNVMHTGKPDVPPYKWKGGPNVWNNRDEGSHRGYFTSPYTWAVPRFEGGVWQYDMFKDHRPNPPECSPSNPADPKYCLLGPFQNTVMNGLYLVLALRLALINKGTGTADAARTELGFLNKWFAVKGDESLLQSFAESTLVRERVATYALIEPDNTYPQVEGYYFQDFWGGDQGLILGGLLDYLTFEPTNPAVQSQAISIARGVFLHLVDSDGVMPYSFGFHDHNDPDDYSCGSGVFWRYLLRGFQQNPALRTEVLNLIKKDPQNNAIYKSAERAFARFDKNNNKLFAYFNILACLLAAIEILTEANKES